MKIALACDHGGLNLKAAIKKHLEKLGHEVVDFGTNSSDSVDYPDYSEKAAKSVASGETECGILVCGTGIGIGIAANKVKGIRCATLGDTFSAIPIPMPVPHTRMPHSVSPLATLFAAFSE